MESAPFAGADFFMGLQMLEISTSQADDLPVLVDIWRRSVQATHHFLSAEDFRAIEEIVAALYLPQVPVLVARDGNGQVVGFMGLTGSNIDSLFIDPEVRGQGFGRQMIAHAQEVCGDVLTVDVNEQNEQAVGFYRKMGFVQTGRSPVDGDGRPYPLLHLRRQQ